MRRTNPEEIPGMTRKPRPMTDAEISRSMREDPWSWLELADTPATSVRAPIRHSYGSGRRSKPPSSPDTDPPRPRAHRTR
jgi:hypothetical protein